MAIATLREATLESRALFSQALGKINRRKYTEALGHLTEAVRISPRNAEYLAHLGVCLARAHEDYERAVHCCEQAVALRPGDPTLLVHLARVYRLQGDNQAAHATLLRAHNMDKLNPGAAVELTRMGIRRPAFFPFLARSNIINVHFGRLRAVLERKLLGRRAC